MINLYPLAIYSIAPDHYQVLFKRVSGEVRYNFYMGGSPGRGIQKTDREFFFDTEADPSAAFISQSILNFDEAIQEGLLLNEGIKVAKPISIEFLRKEDTECFVYRVNLMHLDEKLSEEINLDYEKGDNLLITWSYGSVSASCNDIGDLVLPAGELAARKLIKAVMFFDLSRYYRLDAKAKIWRHN